MSIKFQKVNDSIVDELIKHYENGLRLGKEVVINDKSYKLIYKSEQKNAFFKSRGLSLYFKVDRSIVRISDHWSESIGNDRSRKLNCGYISNSQYWKLNFKAKRYQISRGSGKYPYTVLIGAAGLKTLNKECEHFKDI